MALQRLDVLARDPSYDCIIVDTPPSRNALAFLDAPKLLARFFEEKLIRWLVLPANRLFSGGMRKALGVLEGLTGAAFIRHLLEFASALFEVRVAFTESLARITALLRSPQTGFLLVTTPTPDTVPEALHLVETLDLKGFRFDGVVLNRTLGYFSISEDERRMGDPGLKEALALIDALQARERRVAEALVSRVPLTARLPELARDVHSLEDLVHVALALRDHGRP
jgi:anion-transporting  ArsA/GET3 family ATPase